MTFFCQKCNRLLNGADQYINGELCHCEYLTTTTTSSSSDAAILNHKLSEITKDRPIKLKQNPPPIYGVICVHHNDEERRGVECPICLREKLDVATDSILSLEFKLKIEQTQYRELEEDYLEIWKKYKRPNETVVEAVDRMAKELEEFKKEKSNFHNTEHKIKMLCDSWAEDHTYMQKLCEKYGVAEIEIYGDSYGVPGIQDLADSLERRITS